LQKTVIPNFQKAHAEDENQPADPLENFEDDVDKAGAVSIGILTTVIDSSTTRGLFGTEKVKNENCRWRIVSSRLDGDRIKSHEKKKMKKSLIEESS
jgi:hypothetical protein